MPALSTPPPAAHPAMRNLRRAQAAIAALATGPFGTEAVTIVQAIGRVLAVQPAGSQSGRRLADGAVPLTVGTVLSPTHTALLASMRSSTINVFARARVGLACVATDANDCRTLEAMLSGLVNRIGAKALSTRCPAPDARQLPHTVEMLLVGCDIVLLCGTLDDTAWDGLVASLGARSVDTSTFRVPGLAPVRIAHNAGKLVVQLGGELGPAFATFVLLLSPLIRRLLGRDDPIPLSTPFVPESAPVAPPLAAAEGLEDGSLVLIGPHQAEGRTTGKATGPDTFPVHGNGSLDALLLALARASGIAWFAPPGAAGTPPHATHFAFDAWLA